MQMQKNSSTTIGKHKKEPCGVVPLSLQKHSYIVLTCLHEKRDNQLLTICLSAFEWRAIEISK